MKSICRRVGHPFEIVSFEEDTPLTPRDPILEALPPHVVSDVAKFSVQSQDEEFDSCELPALHCSLQQWKQSLRAKGRVNTEDV